MAFTDQELPSVNVHHQLETARPTAIRLDG
jgi:hypothetical protein